VIIDYARKRERENAKPLTGPTARNDIYDAKHDNIPKRVNE
jgi:hypothetical protein